MKRFSISTLLLGLMLSAVLPFVLFFAFLLSQLQISENAALERDVVISADAVKVAVQPALAEMVTTLNLVAPTEELVTGDFEAFHNRMVSALGDSGNFILVVDENGQQLLNTRVEYGTELGRTSNTAALEASLKLGSIYVSDVFEGRTSREWVFNVIMPLEQQPRSSARAVITTKNAKDLTFAFDGLELPANWNAAIVDQNGRVVAAHGSRQIATGSVLMLTEGIGALDFDLVRGFQHFDANGTASIAGYTVIYPSGWQAVVWGPAEGAQAPLLSAWRQLILGALLFLAISMGVLYTVSRALNLTIQQIAEMAARLGDGEIVSPVTTRVIELDRTAKALSEASFDRTQKEETLQVVMRELAHRSKNLMSVVLSMVRLSSRQTNDVETMTEALSNRILGLGKSIDLLTQRDWRRVPLADLVREQTSGFGEASVEISGPRLLLRAEAVQHLGMALHELSTNAGETRRAEEAGRQRQPDLADGARRERGMGRTGMERDGRAQETEPGAQGVRFADPGTVRGRRAERQQRGRIYRRRPDMAFEGAARTTDRPVEGTARRE